MAGESVREEIPAIVCTAISPRFIQWTGAREKVREGRRGKGRESEGKRSEEGGKEVVMNGRRKRRKEKK